MHLPDRCLASCAGLTAALLLATATGQSIRSYGAGTPGTGGKTPALWATTTPRVGNNLYGLTIERGLPNAPAVGFVSLQSQDVTVGGVRVLIDFASGLQLPPLLLDGSGSGVYKLPIPATPSLLGARVMNQVFVADSGGASLGFSATQGLDTFVANTGLLLGTRSTGSANQTMIAINLDSGQLGSFRAVSQSNVGNPDIYPGDGSYCVTGSGRTNMVALFDCRPFPPVFVREFATPMTPWAVTWTPDGQRLYVVQQGPLSSSPSAWVRWGNPLLPTFGQDFPGNDINLGVGDALEIVFTSDGNTGIVGTLGLLGGALEVRRYDTRPGSTTYNTETGKLSLTSRFLWGMCRIDDLRFAIAESGLGTQVTVHIVDVPTMTIAKSFSPAPFGQVIRGMTADPRGRYVYVGNAPSTRWNSPAGVIRVNVDPTDPGYGTTTNISAGMSPNWEVYDVEVADAGDRIYCIAGTGIQTGFTGLVMEYDATTLGQGRTWNVTGLGNLYNLLIR